jgi:hypothetical protein
LLTNILKIQPSPLTYKLLLDFSNSILNNSPPRQLFDTNSKRLTEYPKLDINSLTEQDKYDLQWYVIGTKTDFVINKPTTVVPSSQGIGLVQSLFVADLEKNITLAKAHVMMHAPVVDKMRDHYIQTVTGIQTVSKGSIVTNA